MATALQTLSGPYGELLVAPDTNGQSAPHYHTTYAIGLSRSGAGTVFARGPCWSYAAGTVVVTNPFDPHWGRPAPGGVRYSLLYPSLSWLRTMLGGMAGAEPMHFDRAVIADDDVAARLAASFDAIVDRGDDSLLAPAVADLFSRHARLAPPPPPAADAPAGGDAPIAGLAAAAGLSRAHYSRAYRKRTGLSPIDHRRQARVLAARSMIEAGASLAEAAADAGFADQAHMTRQFRQILGVTPRAYRPQA